MNGIAAVADVLRLLRLSHISEAIAGSRARVFGRCGSLGTTGPSVGDTPERSSNERSEFHPSRAHCRLILAARGARRSADRPTSLGCGYRHATASRLFGSAGRGQQAVPYIPCEVNRRAAPLLFGWRWVWCSLLLLVTQTLAHAPAGYSDQSRAYSEWFADNSVSVE